MKNSWHILREFLESHVLPEERMYRGETGVRFKDITALYKLLARGDDDSDYTPYSSDPKVRTRPNTDGDSVTCKFPASSRVWGRWSRNPSFTTIFASTDRDQEPGKPQGHHVVKQNYGGRISNSPGKARGDFERMGSAMDRYDVAMIGDVDGGAIKIPSSGNVTFPTGGQPPGQREPKVLVSRIAFSPAIGSSEERTQRIMDLLAGKPVGALKRQPQPHVPEPPSRPEDPRHHSRNEPAHDVPRATGGNMGMGTSASRNKGR